MLRQTNSKGALFEEHSLIIDDGIYEFNGKCDLLRKLC